MFVGERDNYMARSIAEASGGGGGSAGVGALVGVVGAMHLDGIESVLRRDFGFRRADEDALCGGPAPSLVGSMELERSAAVEIPIVS